MSTSALAATRRSRLVSRLHERDDYGVVMLLILATIVAISFGEGKLAQLVGVTLSGCTLLFVLHTSDAHPRFYRAAAAVVVIALAGAAASWVTDVDQGGEATNLLGLSLAFAAPVIILRRLLRASTVTIRVVLGALSIYLLVGLTFAYLYPLVPFITDSPFFVQTDTPTTLDYVYFSYVTLTTVGYGDFSAATNLGRMLAVSEALSGQLYLVSAVALLVGNLGRTRGHATSADASPGPDDAVGDVGDSIPTPP